LNEELRILDFGFWIFDLEFKIWDFGFKEFLVVEFLVFSWRVLSMK